MKNSSSFITLFSVAVLISLALTLGQAKDNAAQHQQSSSLASKLIPQTKARSARSLGDMFEKVRSKIFGSRKQTATTSNSQAQPVASVNVAQRQPWGDLNSFNQQYSPYSSLSSNYQWPSSTNNQYLGQQYNPIGFSSPAGSSSYPSITGTSSQPGSSSMGSMDSSQGQSSLNPAANSNNANNGGLLSSASHLIAQYLSPTSGSSSGSSNVQSNPQSSPSSPSSSSQQQQQQQLTQGNGVAQSLLSPQQNSQYNEFASILDSMVAQTGATSQRQPSLNQYMNSAMPAMPNQQGMPQQQSGMQGYQPAPSGGMMSSGSMIGDQDMSASSSVQSYMPASPQQANQKSSMVGLAEQLAPGANFNKLVSFPFSLSSNEDPSKEGRYKLHIPFLNQHVKRSDPQVTNTAATQQRAQQQYLNSYYNQQQQQYAASLANQQAQQQHQQNQLLAQPSQVAPTIVSPQSSVVSPQQSQVSSSSHVSQIASNNSPVASSSLSSPVVPSQQNSAISSASSSPSSQSSSSSSSSSVPQSSSALLPPPSVSAQSNSRPTWSVADLQASSSSSKLIPMPSAASSSVDSASPPPSQN